MNTKVTVCKKANAAETEIVNSLKRIKNRVNRKINKIILSSAAAILLVLFGGYLLFFAPLKNVPLEELSITADVYSVADLLENQDPAVTTIEIPEHGMQLTASAAAKFSHVAAITITSDYFLKNIEIETRNQVAYITEPKTTLLNNNVSAIQSQLCRLELEEINKIVFVERSGAETVLWSK